MLIARYVIDEDPAYGVIDAAVNNITDETKIIKIIGDPFFSGIQTTGTVHTLSEVRLVTPVIPRSKIVGIGHNFSSHAVDTKDAMEEKEPLMFLKPNTAVIGPKEPVTLPSFSGEVSCEAGLAVVIGRICKDVPLERVDEVVFGYTCANDLTARDRQREDGQWARAKGWDGSCPLGPWIVTDFDPGDARIRGELFGPEHGAEGIVKQEDTTAHMILSVRELVSYVSHAFTLLPGDVILTGTPAGVGVIGAGGRYDVTIEGIGTLSNTVSPPGI